MDSDLLTKEQIGKRLSIKPETIARLARQGKIPQIKISHKIVRYDYSAVIAALQPSAGRGEQ